MTKQAVLHIAEALDALRLVIGRLPDNKAKFISDGILQDATLMRLQDAGEQLVRVRDVFPDYFNTHNTESWHKLIGLRNIISHSYLEVDMEKIWDIVTTNIPDLIRELEILVKI